MRCKSAQRLLSALREGVLPPRRGRSLSRHLEQCGACREMAEDERRLVGAFEALSPPPLSSDLRTSLIRRMTREAPAPTETRIHWSPRIAYAMASVAAILVFAVGVWTSFVSHDPPPVAVVSVVVGEVEQRLSDLEGWRPVHSGDTLSPESQLLSRDSGMAILTTESGASLMVAPETTLSLRGPSEVQFEIGRVLVRSPREIRIITGAGPIVTSQSGGRIALRSESPDRVDVEVSGFSATWAALNQTIPIAEGSPVTLTSGAPTFTAARWAEGEWNWLEALEQARARQLLRETHPSLLPERRTSW